jgi:hypothetical protein
MDDVAFQRKLDRAELEELIDRKIAAAKRRIYATIAIVFVCAVIVAVGVVFTILHFAAVGHWPS